jgi:Fe-S-cluster-containing dehydrogenase component
MVTKKCENCGALLKGNICEYCKTEYDNDEIIFQSTLNKIHSSKMTNYQRIKNMNIEELAEFLSCDCSNCKNEDCIGVCDIGQIERWLKREAKDKYYL